MSWLQIVAGALAGSAAGALVCWLSSYFVARYRAIEQEPAGKQISSTPSQSLAGALTPMAGLVMAGMALWGAYVGWQAGQVSVAASALMVTTLLLTITVVDFQVRRIPNELILALLLWAVVQSLWLGQPALTSAALGLAAGGGLFLLLALIGRGSMGMGDVKLAAAIGALTGHPQVWAALLLGILAGGAAALFLVLSGRAGRKDPIAYGPYLALGAWLVLIPLWGLWPM